MSRIILMVAFFCFGRQAQAQEKNFRKIMPGFEIGLNTGQQQLRGSDQVASLRNGIRAGLLLEKPATKRLTFLGVISYVQAGANEVRFTTNDERLNYAAFSIKAVEYVPIGGSDVYLSLGPYFSYGINGKVTSSSGEIISDNPFEMPEYQRSEWGLGGNVGLKTPWGSYLQAGFQTAFNNVYETTNRNYFNYSVMITAGHTFGWRNFKSIRKKT